MLTLLAALCVCFSALSDFGSATHGLAENGRRGESHMSTRAGLLAELRAAEAQREVMARPAPPRPSSVVQAAMAGAAVPAWALRATDGCKDVLTDANLIKACRPLTSLHVELAQATGYETLSEQVKALRARVEALGVVATKDPVARVVEDITARLGLKLSGADTFSMMVVLLLQLGTIAGFTLVASLRSSMISITSAPTSVAAALEIFRETAPDQVADATTGQLVEPVTVTPPPVAPPTGATATNTAVARRGGSGGRSPASAGRSATVDHRAVAPAPARVDLLGGGNVVPLRSNADAGLAAKSRPLTVGGSEGAGVEGSTALAAPEVDLPPSVAPPASKAPVDDHVATFVGDRLRMERGSTTPAAELQKAYQDYCTAVGIEPLSWRRVGDALARMGLSKSLTNGRTMYRDVGIVA